MTFVAECNDDLDIARFTEFADFDKFHLESDLPPRIRSKRFNIGDPIPIPFWINGELRIVMGDTQASRDMPQQIGEGVMSSVMGLLKSARSGQLRQQSLQWQSDYLRGANPDIFTRSPRDTRHWVARFAVVAREVDWKSDEKSRLKTELQELSYIWLHKHLDNTSYLRLSIFLGVGKPHMFGARRRADVMQAYLQNMISRGRFKDIEKHVMDYELRKMFPKGLTGRKFTSWSDIKYPISTDVSLTDCFLEYVRSATQIDEWSTVERLTFLLFGNRDIPHELLVQIRDYIMHTSLNMNAFRHDRNNYEIPNRRDGGHDSVGHFGWLPSEYFPNMDGVKAIMGIIDGKQRLVPLNYDSVEEMMAFEKEFFRLVERMAKHVS